LIEEDPYVQTIGIFATIPLFFIRHLIKKDSFLYLCNLLCFKEGNPAYGSVPLRTKHQFHVSLLDGPLMSTLPDKSELEKKVEERTIDLLEAIARAKVLSEMKSRFVSMASHEFRTPLSTILSSVSLLEHYTNPDQQEKRHKHITRIKSSVRDLIGILEDFLSLEKLEAGKLEFHYGDFDLKEFIEEIIDEMDEALKRKTQQIDFRFTGALQVFTDKKILRNIILNLLSNAMKYSCDNKIIYLAVNSTGMETIISVKDEGIGIPLEDQKNLFSQFFRSQNVSDIPGTGLGLNIVKRYVEILNGNIHFTSQENAGTTFTVQFPAGKASS